MRRPPPPNWTYPGCSLLRTVPVPRALPPRCALCWAYPGLHLLRTAPASPPHPSALTARCALCWAYPGLRLLGAAADPLPGGEALHVVLIQHAQGRQHQPQLQTATTQRHARRRQGQHNVTTGVTTVATHNTRKYPVEQCVRSAHAATSVRRNSSRWESSASTSRRPHDDSTSNRHFRLKCRSRVSTAILSMWCLTLTCLGKIQNTTKQKHALLEF